MLSSTIGHILLSAARVILIATRVILSRTRRIPHERSEVRVRLGSSLQPTDALRLARSGSFAVAQDNMPEP
jgi:hypothetical protein